MLPQARKNEAHHLTKAMIHVFVFIAAGAAPKLKVQACTSGKQKISKHQKRIRKGSYNTNKKTADCNHLNNKMLHLVVVVQSKASPLLKGRKAVIFCLYYKIPSTI